MDKLLKKRLSVEQQVKVIHDALDKIYDLETIDPKQVSLKFLEKKTESLAIHEKRYETLYEDLIEKADETDLPDIHRANEEFQRMCNNATNMIEKITATLFPPIKTEPKTSDTTVMEMVKELVDSQSKLLSSFKDFVDSKTKVTEPSYTEHVARLPKLDLKTFSGGYTEWREFFDIFVCAVHDRKHLAPVQKLQYLKSCLKGEALNLVKALTLKDENYPIAINQLKMRYDNIKTIREAHFHNIFNLVPMQSQTAIGIRKLCARLYENVQALRNLKEPTESWDSWLVYVLKVKLDQDTRMEWERHISATDNPKFEEMVKFLNEFASAMELSEQTTKGKRSLDTSNSSGNNRSHNVSMHASSNRDQCFWCSDDHRLPQCEQFLALSPEERKNKVRELRLCMNCFSRKHFIASCPKPASCHQCNGKHHPTLHFAKVNSGGYESVNVSSHVACPTQDNIEILLSTALVKVRTADGQLPCRALIDPGSQISFVTSSFVQRARLRRTRAKREMHVKGIGGCTKGVVTDTVNCELINTGMGCDQPIVFRPYVMDKITGNLPQQKVTIGDWPKLKELTLADEQCDIPGPVDMLIGADLYPQILLNEMIKSSDGKLIAQQTVFGWIVSGTVGRREMVTADRFSHFTTSDTNTDEILRQFWEIETVQTRNAYSLEEKECEKHFEQTCVRDRDGRYVVSLPFKDGPELGLSRDRAVSRLQQVERKLGRDPNLQQQYSSVVEEYFQLNHAEKIPENELGNKSYYMPHHCVIKDSSITTKLRVVFDASAKTTEGVSLNERLMIGPKVQDDLFDILVRFRKFPVAFSADVAKMYRQIRLSDSDKDYHRFLWRSNNVDEICDYRMTVVTFGVASSPYLAQRVLKQLAYDEKENFPLATAKLEEDFYMDDLVSGADDTTSAICLKSELDRLLDTGGFELRKWICSDPLVLQTVESTDQDQTVLDIDLKNSVAKTLGVVWNSTSDRFLYRVNFGEKSVQSETVTKRQLLSETARVFDPLGLLTPTLMCAKIMFQKLWLLGLNWDDQLPDTELRVWQKWKADMNVINNLKSERCIVPRNGSCVVDYQLHGFGDASEHGYAGVVYLRTVQSDGNISVKLVCAKTKVAPTKQISLPRLELCAALLLARLLHKVFSALKIHVVTLHAWSDSTVTLDWIRGNPNRWKTFVANRVSEIQSLMNPSQWRFCPGVENPSDCASRGVMPSELINHVLWWTGPTWLSQSEDNWPPSHKNQITTEEKLPEQRTGFCSIVVRNGINEMDMFPYSSLSKLVHVSAWCFRWIKNHKSHHPNKGHLTCSEIDQALIFWIKVAQREGFADEIHRLENKEELSNKSRLLPLCSFMDNNGVLRVGGRLGLAKLPYDKKHQILLPRKHRLTELIIEAEHKRNLHAGPQLLVAALQQRYWIIGARDLVRNFVQKCVTCRRHRAKLNSQLMGSLPTVRTTPAKPFTNTGVDYAGPLLIKYRTRSPGEKCYVALFICFAIKAIHLELVSSASTEAFLAAFRRFTARRGKPRNVYSDNGSNFLGADKELKRLLKSAEHNQNVAKTFSQENIEWHFSPAGAPHFGGLWEAGVKSMKQHLRRIVGGISLTYEELNTVLVQIEACLNSRPLCPLSSDPSDLEALTPGHFLIGTALNALPEIDLTDVKVNRLNRWQHVQTLYQHFWKRWSVEYISGLQNRPKWTKVQRNIDIGDLVIIREDNLPPLKWLMARVVELHPGRDGLVRVATLKTANGLCKRPVVKLAILLHEN